MRMIIVDRACGYIFDDRIASTPIQAIEDMNEGFGNFNSKYHQTSKNDDSALYDVYRAGKDFPPVYDGTDQNLIEALERSGKYIASIASNNDVP